MTVQHGKDAFIALQTPSRNLAAPAAPSADNRLGHVVSWRLTIHQSFQPRETFLGLFHTYLHNKTRWTVELEMALESDGGLHQDALWEAILPDDFTSSVPYNRQVQMNLYLNERQCYYGAAYIEQAEALAASDGAAAARFLLRGNGRLRYWKADEDD